MLRVSVVLNAMSPLRLASIVVALGVAAGAQADPLIGSAYPCTNCPLRIPDAGASAAVPAFAEAQITVTPGGCAGNAPVGGIEVEVFASHGNIGDLRLRLRDPGGTYYPLVDRPSSVGGASGSCPGDDVGLLFLESATTAAPTCSELIPSFGGETQAPVSLAAFSSTIPTGTWTLEAGDYVGGGYGNLHFARLQFYCTPKRSLFRDGLED